MNNNTYGINVMYVGKKLEQFKVYGDYVMLDIKDDGIHVYVFFKDITEHELSQFKSEKPYEICLTMIDDVIFFMMKFGSLNWMDFPYNVHLSRLTGGNLLPITNDNQRYTVYLCVGDSTTGKIMHLREITLENRESKILHKLIEVQRENTILIRPFYDEVIENIYRHLTTKEMLNYRL